MPFLAIICAIPLVPCTRYIYIYIYIYWCTTFGSTWYALRNFQLFSRFKVTGTRPVTTDLIMPLT